jgi:hypothetical protein
MVGNEVVMSFLQQNCDAHSSCLSQKREVNFYLASACDVCGYSGVSPMPEDTTLS